MQPVTEDSGSAKKATNLSINKDLLAEARTFQINLSATLEEALLEKIKEERRKKWLQENRDALNACNEIAEKNGLFSDKYRVF
ncbi:MAG: type II toxin-antitoxin system CcdA family antitoxin [Cellvibrionaceae bacterium]